MPEYLAPSVYVEETSFRSKSIEGVSTSTTAFIGPTRKGPLKEPPELIASYVDFERVYGGFSDLDYLVSEGSANTKTAKNYIAHAVKNYFDNGGARLFIARVYNPSSTHDGFAKSDLLEKVADATRTMQAVARFPGKMANGSVRLQKAAVPARAVQNSPLGSVLSIKELDAGPARLITTNKPPYVFSDGGELHFTVAGGNPNGPVDVTFLGKPAEAVAQTSIGETVVVDVGNGTIQVNFTNSVDTLQTINLPLGDPVDRAEIVDRINGELLGGYARLEPDTGTDAFLVIGTEVKGVSAYVNVKANAALGIDSEITEENALDGDNTVPDLNNVTVADINTLVSDGGILNASLEQGTKNMIIETTATGGGIVLTLLTGDADSVHAKLAFPETVANGTPEQTDVIYVKAAQGWFNGGDKLVLPAPATAELISLNVITEDSTGEQQFYDGIGLDRSHSRYVGDVFNKSPSRRADAIEHLYAIEIADTVTTSDMAGMLFANGDEYLFELKDGNDGLEPVSGSYRDAPDSRTKSPFEFLMGIEDVSIVAAPGYSAFADARGIQEEIIGHVERRRAYRVAVLDTPKDNTINQAKEYKSSIDSTYAALYYPWIVTPDPASSTPREIVLPPSGFVCGIYARNDISKGVSKSPGNEIVRGALRFENDVNFAEQELLNPLGVNCLRFFPGRGYRLWGARTTSSDPEWKYVGPRRYFVYLEHSIDRSTQWAVFENNGPRLWANVREAVSGFLYNEWRSGSLLGTNPDEAYFVRCDRSTMTQNDLDNGRMICLIGVSVLKPAEFVIFRIGQKTAEARA